MLKKQQKPLEVKDQVKNLKSIGLIIKDENEAEKLLNDISYFRIVKGYSLGLKDKETGLYKKEVSFDSLKQLYLFNAKLRYIIFPEIEKVEINLRCRMANYFSLKYGVLGYLNVNNFGNPKYHTDFLKDIQIEIARNSKMPFVKNFKNNYDGGELPFYAVVELLSFGTLSKLFKNMKNEDKKAIAKIYGIKYTYIQSWIEHLAFVRNICAHYGRLYNINFSKSPLLFSEYSKLGVSNLRVYATLICLKHLLSNDDHWERFVARIGELLMDYPEVQKGLMGFPKDGDYWGEILLLPIDEIRKIIRI